MNVIILLERCLRTLQTGETLLVTSIKVRNNQIIEEEFFDSDGEYIYFMSNDTFDGEWVNEFEEINRIIQSTYPILKIVKVSRSGSRRTLYDYNNIPRRPLPAQRRPRRTN